MKTEVERLRPYALARARRLYRFMDEESAQDLAQDAMLNICIAVRRGQFDGRFIPTKLVNASVLRLYMRRKRNKDRIQMVDEPETCFDTFVEFVSDTNIARQPEAAMLSRAQSAALLSAISRIKPMHREPLILFVDGMTYPQIAAHLQIGMGAVQRRIYEARQKLFMLLPEVYHV